MGIGELIDLQGRVGGCGPESDDVRDGGATVEHVDRRGLVRRGVGVGDRAGEPGVDRAGERDGEGVERGGGVVQCGRGDGVDGMRGDGVGVGQLGVVQDGGGVDREHAGGGDGGIEGGDGLGGGVIRRRVDEGGGAGERAGDGARERDGERGGAG